MEGNNISSFHEHNAPTLHSRRSNTSPNLKKIHYPLAYELELNRVIELTAYLLAEKDGFKRTPMEYWLAAERDC